MLIKKVVLYTILSLLLCSCGTSSNTGQSLNEQPTKQIELFDMILTVPDYCFLADPSMPGYPSGASDDIAYLLFYEDENDSEEKWRNQLFIQNLTGVNATPNITYDQARTVVADPAKAMFDFNPQWEVTSKESVDLEQTPALHYTANWPKWEGTCNMWFFMKNYHDVIVFSFFHNNKAKNDFTSVVDEIAKNIHFKGLEGELALLENDFSISNSDTNSDSDKELAKRVYMWCQERFEYYDKKDGYYTGDKHDDDVFEDAAKHFGKSKTEVRKLYDDGGVYIVNGE